tara:strand:+ start:1621 stop:2160 length:540 start_codon:yes stop_codon:yes gene_type:complete
MHIVSRGQRSSLYREGDVVYRYFHDTGTMSVVPTRIDHRGVRRYEHNRTERSLSGALSPRTRGTPGHLARAGRALLASTTIDEITRECGVKRSTAWQYVNTVCAASPAAAKHVLAKTTLICPELEEAASHVNLQGALSTVMTEIESLLNGSTEWRCAEDRYSQLRLLRVCLESARGGGD